MKVITILTATILFFNSTFSQNIKVFQEPSPSGNVLYVDNTELYPVSILLELSLTNFTFSEGSNNIFLIPPRTEKYKIGELTKQKLNQKTHFSFKYRSAMGDVQLISYEKNYSYDLPFIKGKSFKLFQGYNGAFSHKDENALDFTMPEGTEVTAARDGIVVKIIQNNTESCAREECKKYNNYVTIMHSDGTFAQYTHIKYNGALCKLGDKINQGQPIAYSGNVGWSSGPHLHFVCFIGGFDKWKTLETKFKIDKENTSDFLKEGFVYTRNY